MSRDISVQSRLLPRYLAFPSSGSNYLFPYIFFSCCHLLIFSRLKLNNGNILFIIFQRHIDGARETINQTAYLQFEGSYHFSNSRWGQSIQVLFKLPCANSAWKVVSRWDFVWQWTSKELPWIMFKNSYWYD